MGKFMLPRPVLERDSSGPFVRLRFDAFSVSGLWVSEFSKREHEHGWPRKLPKPYYEHGEVRVKDLRPEDVARFVEALREWVDATNEEVDRLRLGIEAQQREGEDPRLKFEEDVAATERTLNELFSAD